MDESDDNLKRTRKAMDEYFLSEYKRKLKQHGYVVPSIGHYNMAKAVFSRTYNKLEKEFLKTIMYAFRNREPLHPGLFDNLARIINKYDIQRIKLTNNGT